MSINSRQGRLVTFGGLKGYSAGKFTTILNAPALNGA